MPVDTFLAFGGVALLGLVGFIAAWVSSDVQERPTSDDAKTKAQRKKLVIAKIAEGEEELQSGSSKISSP